MKKKAEVLLSIHTSAVHGSDVCCSVIPLSEQNSFCFFVFSTMEKMFCTLGDPCYPFFIFSTSFTPSLESREYKILQQPSMVNLLSDIMELYDHYLMFTNNCNHFICLYCCCQILFLHFQVTVCRGFDISFLSSTPIIV